MKLRILLAGFALSLMAVIPAHAQTMSAIVVSTCGTPPTTYVAGQTFPATQDTNGNACENPVSSGHLVSSTLTKISGAGTYTSATTTAPEAICLFASVTACAPMTTTVSSVVTASGFLTKVALVKSTTGATGATFRVFVYQGAPTLTGVYNTSTYLTLIADLQSGAYLGSWECLTQVVNTDNSYYDCSSNTAIGYNQFNLTDGILRFVVVATGAYVSGSSETFNIISDTSVSMP